MRTERKTYADGTKKLYAVEQGQATRLLIIGKAKNISKHI